MTEEDVTRIILEWLSINGWEIVAFDFPGSGTGIFLHPEIRESKNKDTINVDIIATKKNRCLIFENKSHFYYQDFLKIFKMRTTDIYMNDLKQLIDDDEINDFKYGIGYTKESHKKKAKDSLNLVDFIIGVDDKENVEILYNSDIFNFK